MTGSLQQACWPQSTTITTQMHSSLALGDAGPPLACALAAKFVADVSRQGRGKKKERKLFLSPYNADSMATAGLKTHYSICHKQFQVQLHSHDAYTATPLPLFARTGSAGAADARRRRPTKRRMSSEGSVLFFFILAPV